MATREGNDLFSSFVNCVVLATIYAEEEGIAKEEYKKIPQISLFGNLFAGHWEIPSHTAAATMNCIRNILVNTTTRMRIGDGIVWTMETDHESIHFLVLLGMSSFMITPDTWMSIGKGLGCCSWLPNCFARPLQNAIIKVGPLHQCCHLNISLHRLLVCWRQINGAMEIHFVSNSATDDCMPAAQVCT